MRASRLIEHVLRGADPASICEGNDKFVQAVEKMAEPVRKSAADGYVRWAHAILEKYTEDVAAKGTSDLRKLYPTNGTMRRDMYLAAQELRSTLSNYLKDTANPSDTSMTVERTTAIRPDVEKVIEVQATRHGQAVAEEFKAKLTSKLAKIIRESEVINIETYGTWDRNTVKIELIDGLKFTVLSQVVSVWPQHARPHHRYPTTFHAISGRGISKQKASQAELENLVKEIKNEGK